MPNDRRNAPLDRAGSALRNVDDPPMLLKRGDAELVTRRRTRVRETAILQSVSLAHASLEDAPRSGTDNLVAMPDADLARLGRETAGPAYELRERVRSWGLG